MTVEVSKIPLSVDYTGRDYYTIREQLIDRVKARVPGWKGTDANDFGVALVEAFAYMGDLINYYIDRVANESYLGTATQRETILNLANMYGYTPAGYVSSVVALSMTNNNGYSGGIGATIVENGTVNGTSYTGVAKVIVPSDHPFVIGDKIRISGVPDTAAGLLGGESVTYNTSIYNGTYTVLNVGYNNIGKNVLWFQPESLSTTISLTGTQFTIGYSGVLIPYVGQKVNISGFTSTAAIYNGNWVVSAIDTNAFTVDAALNTATITNAKGTGSVMQYSGYNANSKLIEYVVGQKVTVTGVKSVGNTGGTAGSGYNVASTAITSVTNTTAIVSEISTSGGVITFRTSEAFVAGDYVTLRNIASIGNEGATAGSGYNLTDATVLAVANETATVTSVTPDTNSIGEITYSATSHPFSVGQYVTITGINPTVYNMKSVKIKRITTNSFTVEGYWTTAFVSGGTATGYGFTVTSAMADSVLSGGTAITRQFKLSGTHSGAYDTSSVASVVTVVSGGTGANTTGKIQYSNLPAVVEGGTVFEIGSTTIPKGSQVQAQVTVNGVQKNVIFSTVAENALQYGETSSTVVAKQGEDISLRAANAKANTYDKAGEQIGTSDGSPDQKFSLLETAVDMYSIQVYVQRGNDWEEWTKVEYVMDFGPTDKVFSARQEANGKVYIYFGDGIAGAIPDNTSVIKAVYIAGGGVIGNVAAETITQWNAIPGLTTLEANNIINNVSVTNLSEAFGGVDPETNDSIRRNAPKALRTLSRAVTLEDFSNLALSVSGVGKASAYAAVSSSVTVYVGPIASDESSTLYPGFVGTEESDQLILLRQAVADFLADKTQIGTTVTVSPPEYTRVQLTIQYAKSGSYSDSTVQYNLKKALTTGFGYNYTSFGDVITPEELEFKLRQVDGVQQVKITALSREGGTGRLSLVGGPNELFVFDDSLFTLVAMSTEAKLSNLTLAALNSGGTSAGTITWNKTWTGSVYTYFATLPATTATVTVTPTALSSTATIAINDDVVASGSSLSVTANVYGVATPIIVTVTAQDGVTILTYQITANKSA
ncbi:Cadherin-like beta sandwich domain containing protein [uncultured Caudovirales phage]|uniref:Cadherin-like beta sandwich domain containing protein n=1 Tax=uncultured Caudovirales phage TaxID=2100421 RepID=A0A6J7WS81_9CAUD|nr:Cadherin-like beta sandwich domain containing protein [uncultured Caudovirales phage]CAB5219645.1 Cadherin-like beta sandwich domain containing protein [uncultured Caudovirales phage]